MKKLRIEIPERISAPLLFLNRHRCCICREPRKPVQIHHVDENPSNNDMRNLAVLCVECHSIVSGNQGFGKNYSKKEILLFKKNWEEQCEGWRQNIGNADDDMEDDEENLEPDDSEEAVEDQEDEPIHTLYKDWIVEGGYNYSFEYNLGKGNEIVYSVSSDERIDFLIMKRSEYNRTSVDGDALMEDDNIFETNDSYTVPRNGWYSIIVCNRSRNEARVTLDLSIWF
jgi:hypothetical protein